MCRIEFDRVSQESWLEVPKAAANFNNSQPSSPGSPTATTNQVETNWWIENNMKVTKGCISLQYIPPHSQKPFERLQLPGNRTTEVHVVRMLMQTLKNYPLQRQKNLYTLINLKSMKIITVFSAPKWEATPHLFTGRFSVTWSSIKDRKVNFKRQNTLNLGFPLTITILLACL